MPQHRFIQHERQLRPPLHRISGNSGPIRETIAGDVLGNPGGQRYILNEYDTVFRGGPANDRWISITNNYLYGDCIWAAYLNNCSYITFANNVVDRISGDGVYADGATVAGNVFADVTNDTITIDSGRGGAPVANNRIINPGQRGIVFEARQGDVPVTGNYVDGSGGHGIYISNNVADSTLVGNRVAGATLSCIHVVSGADYNIYVANNIRGNTNSGFGGTVGANSQQVANIT
jgi:hypothetical protein